MIKVEVIEEFTLQKFNELKNLVRKGKDEKGSLYVGDTFECDKEMAEYLTGKNDLNKTVVKVIEVMPEEVEPDEVEEVEEVEEAPKAKTTKTRTKKK